MLLYKIVIIINFINMDKSLHILGVSQKGIAIVAIAISLITIVQDSVKWAIFEYF